MIRVHSFFALALEKIYILQCLKPPWQTVSLTEEFALLIELCRHPVTPGFSSSLSSARQQRSLLKGWMSAGSLSATTVDF